MGATDSEEIGRAIREANARADVKAVMLNIDPPGGSGAGTPELAHRSWHTGACQCRCLTERAQAGLPSGEHTRPRVSDGAPSPHPWRGVVIAGRVDKAAAFSQHLDD